ncbi:hypothetical protein HK101_003711, partial [Irineochytrium annulatum]
MANQYRNNIGVRPPGQQPPSPADGGVTSQFANMAIRPSGVPRSKRVYAGGAPDQGAGGAPPGYRPGEMSPPQEHQGMPPAQGANHAMPQQQQFGRPPPGFGQPPGPGYNQPQPGHNQPQLAYNQQQPLQDFGGVQNNYPGTGPHPGTGMQPRPMQPPMG